MTSQPLLKPWTGVMSAACLWVMLGGACGSESTTRHRAHGDRDRTGDTLPGGDSAGEEIVATPGFCPIETRAGRIEILDAWESLAVNGAIYDGVPPIYGPAKLSEPPCAHYYPQGLCGGGCNSDQVCQYDGTCGAEVLSRKDVSVTVQSPAGSTTTTANATTGQVYTTIDRAQASEAYQMIVRIPGAATISFSSPLPASWIDGVSVDDSSTDGLSTGSIVTSWTPADDGSAMELWYFANHHARIGFTVCRPSETAGSCATSAALIDPLRTVTGFEGGQATRQFVAHADLSWGCVELATAVQTSAVPF